MPIYEFRCTKCQTKFEQLCKIAWQSTVKCPNCQSTELERIMSAFASPGQQSSSCGGCSGKCCSSCK